MKRALHGMPAYSSILSAELPEKTKTYTPIQHGSIINRVREEIRDAGFIIIDEMYRASNEGKIALGTFKLKYKSDPDIDLCASFVNSYNKQYAFRFNLGGITKINNTAMILNNSKLGAYKRVHKGEADILAAGKISEFIGEAGEYWTALIEHKKQLKEYRLSPDVKDMILGKLFFSEKILNGMQMNIIQKELANPSFDYKVELDSAWALYNHIALSMKEARPATWMSDQIALHDAFDEVLDFGSPLVGHWYLELDFITSSVEEGMMIEPGGVMLDVTEFPEEEMTVEE